MLHRKVIPPCSYQTATGMIMKKRTATANLSRLATPDASPWRDRHYKETGNDQRGSYSRDRDRIMHSDSFRKLQYKTQVFVVHEGDFFRTRLTHTLEVSQIGRGIARILKLNEPLVEAICLAHDLGHTAFGHAGEHELQEMLKQYNLEWNSNAHSLQVIEELELQYCEHFGLNLTWVTREGLARHQTFYDVPSAEQYGIYAQPSLEAQLCNLADVIAYATHDIEDALVAGILQANDLSALHINIWDTAWRKANDEYTRSQRLGFRPGVDKQQIVFKRAHRHLIDALIRDSIEETKARANKAGVKAVEEARGLNLPLVALSVEIESEVKRLLDFMMGNMYRSPVIARQSSRAAHILRSLFTALIENHKLLPVRIQERIDAGNAPAQEIARFLAALTDRSAVDLYTELFEPTERSLGHKIL